MATSFVGKNTVDTHELTDFARRIRLEAPADIKREERKAIRKAGALVAVRAKEIASEHSTSIPPTVKVLTRGATVMVQAGSDAVPLARLYEKGNKGSRSDGDTFKHPLFGDWDYPQVQERYPFLEKAAEERGAEAAQLIKFAIYDAVNRAALREG